MSRFCSLLSFLIVFPFVRLRDPGRDYTNNFFAIPLKPCVSNEEKHTRCDGPQGVPSLLGLEGRIPFCQSVRVIEDKNCSLEADIVFQQIPSVLLFVPLEAHGWYPAPNPS